MLLRLEQQQAGVFSVYKSPAFQFYPQDFLSDMNVRTMNNSELGAYIRLLCTDWIEGGIPDDDQILNSCSGSDNWDQIKEKVLKCFELKNNKYFNKRLEKERKKQKKFKQDKSKAGIASGKARKNKAKDAVETNEQLFDSVQTEGQQKTNRRATESNSSSLSLSSSLSSISSNLNTEELTPKPSGNQSKPKSESRSKQVPEDWEPKPDVKTWVMDQGLTAEDARFELGRFIDDSSAKGRKYKNFNSAFKNWIRNYLKFANPELQNEIKKRRYNRIQNK